MRSRVTAPSVLAALVLALAAAPSAMAAQTANAPDPGPTNGGQSTAPAGTTQQTKGSGCSLGSVLLGILNPVDPLAGCTPASLAAGGVASLAGGAASAAVAGLAGNVMDQVTLWMVTAAQTIDADVMSAATATSTPELTAQWYQSEFAYVASFGAALAGLVALLGILSASLRGDAGVLGEVLYGVLRAGLVTAMVISLTLLALDVADGISSNVAQHMPKQFFASLAGAWGGKGWGGLASSALAFVTALIEVIVAFLLWIELLFRNAAIYVAVLFFPFTLAMAIWPRLSGAHAKLVRTLGIFIAFKPAALIMMMTGANLLLGGVSFYAGVAASTGTILAGLAVLAMAAFAPWALMHLVGLEAGVMSSASAGRGHVRGAATGAGPAGAGTGAGTGGAGGELFAGPITFGGAAGGAPASGVPGRGSPPLGGSPRPGPDSGEAGGAGAAANIGGENSRGILPGPVAAAAGLLPAGLAAAQSVAAVGQSLAGNAAARVHAASGHGATRPPSPSLHGAQRSPSAAPPNGQSASSPVTGPSSQSASAPPRPLPAASAGPTDGGTGGGSASTDSRPSSSFWGFTDPPQSNPFGSPPPENPPGPSGEERS